MGFGLERLAFHSRVFVHGQTRQAAGFEAHDSAAVGKVFIPGDVKMDAVPAIHFWRGRFWRVGRFHFILLPSTKKDLI